VKLKGTDVKEGIGMVKLELQNPNKDKISEVQQVVKSGNNFVEILIPIKDWMEPKYVKTSLVILKGNEELKQEKESVAIE